MSLKKFEKGDLLHNIIKAKPRFEFKVWNGNIYLNNDGSYVILNGALQNISCGNENTLDFSCPETSYNVGLI